MAYIVAHDVTRFAVVDDDDDVVDTTSPAVFITNPEHGLTDEVANKIINYLNTGEKQ